MNDDATTWLKSVLVQNQAKKHGLPILPLLQGSLPKNKGSWGNNFSRRICQRGSKIHSSSKTPLFWKNHWFRKCLVKCFSQKIFGIEKWKVANRPKRVLPKFHADPSFVRGVNGRSKFRKKIGNVRLGSPGLGSPRLGNFGLGSAGARVRFLLGIKTVALVDVEKEEKKPESEDEKDKRAEEND